MTIAIVKHVTKIKIKEVKEEKNLEEGFKS